MKEVSQGKPLGRMTVTIILDVNREMRSYS